MDSTPPTFNLGSLEEIFPEMNTTSSDEELSKWDMGIPIPDVTNTSTASNDRFQKLSDRMWMN